MNKNSNQLKQIPLIYHSLRRHSINENLLFTTNKLVSKYKTELIQLNMLTTITLIHTGGKIMWQPDTTIVYFFRD